MGTFLAQHRHLEETQVHRGLHLHNETKPANDTTIEIEINSHHSSNIDMCRHDGIHAIESSGFGPRDRDISANPLLVSGLVHDLAGQASPKDMDNAMVALGG